MLRFRSATLCAAGSFFASIAAASPAGVSVAWWGGTVFVYPHDGVVYGDRCTENVLAPKSIEDCFGRRPWPTATTPFLTEAAVKREIEKSLHDPLVHAADIRELGEMIAAREASIPPLEKQIVEKTQRQGQYQTTIDFLKQRLADPQLPVTEKAAIEREIAFNRRIQNDLERDKSSLATRIDDARQKMATMKAQIEKYEALRAPNVSFNAYLHEEAKRLFTATVVRNLSKEESFGGLLGRLFGTSGPTLGADFDAPQITLDWAGDEGVPEGSYSPAITYRNVYLKRLSFRTAASPGLLRVEATSWVGGNVEAEIAVSEAMLREGGVIEGDAIPSALREPKGVLAVRPRRDDIQFGLVVGTQIGRANWKENKFDLIDVGGSYDGGKDNVKATTPFAGHEFTMGKAKMFLNGRWRIVHVRSRYNGSDRLKLCAPRLILRAAIDKLDRKPAHQALNGDELAFTEHSADLANTGFTQTECTYEGKRQLDWGLPGSIQIDGVTFRKKRPSQP